MSRRRGGAFPRFRALAGFALAPSALAAVFAAVSAFGGLTRCDGGAEWFLGAFCAYLLSHLLRWLTFQRAYVFAHEFAHALAAWATGGKVFAFVVRKQSGHVDLSHTSAFICLAPYWVPVYALAAVGAYRAALWGGNIPRAREAFLAVMGAALAFHIAHTVEALWTTHQSDLDEAGFPLSISLIVFLNGLILLVSAKCLFPASVSLADGLGTVARVTSGFWMGLWSLAAAAWERAPGGFAVG